MAVVLLVTALYIGCAVGFAVVSGLHTILKSLNFHICCDPDIFAVLQIHNSCFFEGVHDVSASCSTANPPYTPAADNQILMLALHGGVDGASPTKVSCSLSPLTCPFGGFVIRRQRHATGSCFNPCCFQVG